MFNSGLKLIGKKKKIKKKKKTLTQSKSLIALT